MRQQFIRGMAKFWREWLRSVVVIVVVITSLRSAVADWNDVPTGSMKPTILEGDRIVVNKLAYDLRAPFSSWRIMSWDDPNRGDIVVLISPDNGFRLVKRVIGLPGDTIEMQANRLIVNGHPVEYSMIGPPIHPENPKAIPGRVLAEESLGEAIHPVMLTPAAIAQRDFTTLLVPHGQYFVMGDNRDESLDSRHFGFVDRKQILGQATAVAASVDPDRRFRPRWERFFQALR